MRSNRPVRWWVTADLVHEHRGRRVHRWRPEGDAADAPQARRPGAADACAPPDRSVSSSPRAIRRRPPPTTVRSPTATSSTRARSRPWKIACPRSRPAAERFRSTARRNRSRDLASAPRSPSRSVARRPRPKPTPTDSGPLQVLRYQPIGDVDIAPDLSVTFNQPMVPLTTLSQLDQADVPVKVTPALNGRWRWIGTRTLRFQFTGAVDRLPMATSYHVVVPAGTASQTGHKLATAVSWTFRTPPPKVLTFAPENTTVDTTPLFVATFDQRVDPGRGDQDHHARRRREPRSRSAGRPTAEIIADDQVHQISQDAHDGRWVAFRPVSPLAERRRAHDLDRARHSLGRGAADHDDRVDPHGHHVLGARGHGHPMRLRRRLPARIRLRDHVQQRPRREVVRREPREDHARARRIDRRRRQHAHGQRGDEARHAIRRAPPGVAPRRVRPDARQGRRVAVRRRRVDALRSWRSRSRSPRRTPRPSPRWRSRRSATRRSRSTSTPRIRRGGSTTRTSSNGGGTTTNCCRPGRKLSTTTITVDGGGKDLTESTIDLSADLHGATGHLLVVVSLELGSYAQGHRALLAEPPRRSRGCR